MKFDKYFLLHNHYSNSAVWKGPIWYNAYDGTA